MELTFTPDHSWAVATHCYRGPAVNSPTDGRIFVSQQAQARDSQAVDLGITAG